MATTNDPYELFTREEAADFLRVHSSTVGKLARSGQLYSVRAGRRMLIPRAALEAWVRGEKFDAGQGGTRPLIDQEGKPSAPTGPRPLRRR